MKMKSVKYNMTLALALIALAGCASSIEKANIPASANPTEEIAKLEADLSYGETNEFEVLDAENFKNSRDRLMKAKSKLSDNKKQEDVLDELRYSRAYYERAKTTSAARKSKLEAVLESRNAALDAGVKKYPRLSDEWNSAEKDTRGLAKDKPEDIKAEDVKKLQNRYSELQYKAVKLNYLGDALAKIEAAKDNNAKSKAPESLKQAEIDYASAETAISANRTTPARFTTEVTRSNRSADRLRRVMDYAKKDGKNFSEKAAIQLVSQEDQINRLDNQLGETRQTNEQLGQTNAQLENRVTRQGQALTAAERQVAMQAAIDSARKEFKPTEADVYQQGDKLLIRVKSLNFATGKSELPNDSDALLNKVEAVAKDLNASEVMVQGHTDSTGSKERNRTLSEERAQKVAKYFERGGLESSTIKAEGYGDSVPLGPNRTKSGRAQNRRIDVIITPSGQQM